jgi:hypothetical protein
MEKIMGIFIDITNKTFGRLTVVDRMPNVRKKTMWSCSCSCGNIIVAESANLKSGKTASCGCIRQEQARINGATVTTHGLTGTPLYIVWDGIKKRASTSRAKSKDYENYIGRGITLCDEWEDDFMKFYIWASSSGYKKGLQIDRINNELGYSEDNCRWVTPFTNSMNRRTSIDPSKLLIAEDLFEMGISIADIARELELGYSGLYQRLTKRRGIEKSIKHFKK